MPSSITRQGRHGLPFDHPLGHRLAFHRIGLDRLGVLGGKHGRNPARPLGARRPRLGRIGGAVGRRHGITSSRMEEALPAKAQITILDLLADSSPSRTRFSGFRAAMADFPGWSPANFSSGAETTISTPIICH
jgi:hypothetical protein